MTNQWIPLLISLKHQPLLTFFIIIIPHGTRSDIIRQHSWFPVLIPTILRHRNSSDHPTKPNPKPPFGPQGLRRQEGPQRVQAHTNDGGNCVQSAGSWDGTEDPAPLFCQCSDSWWFRTRAAQERERSERSSTGTLQQSYPNPSIHEMAEWIMADPMWGPAFLCNHPSLHRPPPLPRQTWQIWCLFT